jgi:hypothetical protein
MLLLDQAYKLFVTVNNRFVADGRAKNGGGARPLPIEGGYRAETDGAGES